MKSTTKNTKRTAKPAASTSPEAAKETTADRIARAIIAALEAGVKPWVRPWSTCATTGNVGPYNAITGKAYRGINVLLLNAAAYAAGATPFADPRWLTFHQGQEMVKKAAKGGKSDDLSSKEGGIHSIGTASAPRFLKEGQHATEIVFWGTSERNETDAAGVEKTKSIPVLRSYRVFNVEQTHLVALGLLPAFVPAVVPTLTRLANAEAIVQGYANRPEIREGAGGDHAYYAPAMDKVFMPKPEAFLLDGRSEQESAEGWYSTLFHELAHSTGAATRLGREGLLRWEGFGSQIYAEEELVAEIAAAMLSSQAGLSPHLDQSAAYVAGWLKVLSGDRKMVEKAARAAQKAVDHILGATFDSGVETADSAAAVADTLNEDADRLFDTVGYDPFAAEDARLLTGGDWPICPVHGFHDAAESGAPLSFCEKCEEGS